MSHLQSSCKPHTDRFGLCVRSGKHDNKYGDNGCCPIVYSVAEGKKGDILTNMCTTYDETNKSIRHCAEK
jgi:hypothetical protein